jgi:hypothetical protein
MKLTTWNWIAAFTHTAITVGLIIYFSIKTGTINFNTVLYRFKVLFNYENLNDSPVEAVKIWDIRASFLKMLVVVFFLFTALFHIIYASDVFGTGIYTQMITNSNNYIRWIEYAISSTIMTFLIAIVSGVKSFEVVVLLLLMNVAMILCGQVIEASYSFNVKFIATLIGWILLGGIVLIFFSSFFITLNEAKQQGFSVPSWVYAIIFPLVLWYSSFGIVSLLQAFRNRTPKNYTKYEKAYIMLSLFSKVNLGIAIAFGLTRPPPEKE